jgi:hypothetical protein
LQLKEARGIKIDIDVEVGALYIALHEVASIKVLWLQRQTLGVYDQFNLFIHVHDFFLFPLPLA